MFTKEEIKKRWRSFVANELATKKIRPKASMNLALLVASSALMDQKQWDGSDYMEHPLFVGLHNTDSTTKQIIGILHDVVEDSDWTLQDFRDLGFEERIIRGVEGVTKRPGELYFDFIERCGQSGMDAIDIKIKDLKHNSMGTRTPKLTQTDKQIAKAGAYNISYYYLVAIKKGVIKPGTKIEDFIETMPQYKSEKEAVKPLLERFSSRFAKKDDKRNRPVFVRAQVRPH